MQNQYQEKIKIVNQVKANLKSKFIGIDSTIDRIFQQLHGWFVYDVPLEAPLVINIWGITGTGKTELVKDICSGLGIESRFFDSQAFLDKDLSVEKLIKSLRTHKTSRAIIIDEFHRIKTKRQNDDVVPNDGRFLLWEILSGEVKVEHKVDKTILNIQRYSCDDEDEVASGTQKTTKTKIDSMHYRLMGELFDYGSYPFNQELYDKILEIKKNHTELHTYIKALSDLIKTLKLNEVISLKQSVIFVLGNLDKAYEDIVEDMDSIDADALSKRLSKITTQECKETLFELFSPEQVSRLGSNHFIMPTLTQASYQSVISKKLSKVTESYIEKFKLWFIFDSSVNDMIYDQLVIPTQGMRNVLSGFNALVDSPIAAMMDKCIEFSENIMQDAEPIFVSYKDSNMIFEARNIINYKELDLPKKIGNKSEEFEKLVATHEAGHALVYYILRGESPVKIVTSTNSSSKGGFIRKKELDVTTRKDLLNNVKISLGGYFAEKIIFGEDEISKGSVGDLKNAGATLAAMVNRYGFGKSIHPMVLGSAFEPALIRTMEKEKDKEIIQLYESSAKEVESLLTKHVDVLQKLADFLESKKTLDQEDMDKFMEQFDILEEDSIFA